MDKTAIHKLLITRLDEKYFSLKNALQELLESTASESKSTVGDKHETGRAMAQLEQEKISNQLRETERMRALIFQLDPRINCQKVVPGCLIETSMGWYYLTAGLGILNYEDKQIFTMNIQAPLGQALAGKKEGDEINWNGKNLTILRIK